MQKPLSWFKDQAINAWIFDLDNTIYPANSGLFKRVERRMTMFVQNHLGIDYEPAYALQKEPIPSLWHDRDWAGAGTRG